MDHAVYDLPLTLKVEGPSAWAHTKVTAQAKDLIYFFQAEDGIRDLTVTGVQTCALPISVGEVVNLGNTEEITIEDLAHRVKERTASSSAIKYIPYDQAYEPGFEDMMRREIGRASCRERV